MTRTNQTVVPYNKRAPKADPVPTLCDLQACAEEDECVVCTEESATARRCTARLQRRWIAQRRIDVVRRHMLSRDWPTTLTRVHVFMG